MIQLGVDIHWTICQTAVVVTFGDYISPGRGVTSPRAGYDFPSQLGKRVCRCDSAEMFLTKSYFTCTSLFKDVYVRFVQHYIYSCSPFRDLGTLVNVLRRSRPALVLSKCSVQRQLIGLQRTKQVGVFTAMQYVKIYLMHSNYLLNEHFRLDSVWQAVQKHSPVSNAMWRMNFVGSILQKCIVIQNTRFWTKPNTHAIENILLIVIGHSLMSCENYILQFLYINQSTL